MTDPRGLRDSGEDEVDDPIHRWADSTLQEVIPQYPPGFVNVHALSESAENPPRSAISKEDDDTRSTTPTDPSSSLPYLKSRETATPPFSTGHRGNVASRGGDDVNQSPMEDSDSLYAEPTPPRKDRAVLSPEYMIDPLRAYGVTPKTEAAVDEAMRSKIDTGPYPGPPDTPRPFQQSHVSRSESNRYPDTEDPVVGQQRHIKRMMIKEMHKQQKARDKRQKARDKQQDTRNKQQDTRDKQQKARDKQSTAKTNKKEKKEEEKSDQKKRGTESSGYSDDGTDRHTTRNEHVLPKPYDDYRDDGKEARTKTPVQWDTATLGGVDSLHKGEIPKADKPLSAFNVPAPNHTIQPTVSGPEPRGDDITESAASLKSRGLDPLPTILEKRGRGGRREKMNPADGNPSRPDKPGSVISDVPPSNSSYAKRPQSERRNADGKRHRKNFNSSKTAAPDSASDTDSQTIHGEYYAPDKKHTSDEESPMEQTTGNGHGEYYAPKTKYSPKANVSADRFSEEETVIDSPDVPYGKGSSPGYSPKASPKVPSSRSSSPGSASEKSVKSSSTTSRKPSIASLSSAGNLDQRGLKTWVQKFPSNSMWLVIALVLVAFCLLRPGSGGSGLTSLAGGGIFLVALAALFLWAWNEGGSTSKKKQDVADIGDDHTFVKSGDNDGSGDDKHNDGEDGDNEGKGPNDMRRRTDEHIDVLGRDRASESGAVGRSNLLHEEAEDRMYALFPDVPREFVQNVFDEYTTAPWTEKPKSLKDLKRAAKEVWQQSRSGEDFNSEFNRLCQVMQKEAKSLFAKLLFTSNGAYLSGDQFRVEMMLEPPVALRITAFPGERVAARPGQVGVRDGYQYLYDKEKKMWKKGLDTIVLMRKHWADLEIANQPDMPPIEIVCFRPPADFTPREFEEHCKLRKESPKYEKKKSKFQRLCQAQVLAGDFAKGHRGERIETLLNVTRPTDIAIDFVPHRHYQAGILNWNEWSSASTLRHVGRFTDVIEAIERYTMKNQLRILDVGPCLPLTVRGKPNRFESGLEQSIGRFSYSNVKTDILRVGLEDPAILRQEGFNEAQQVAKTLCDPRVKVLNMFQSRQGRAASSFLLGIAEKQQMNDLKETVEAEFEQRLRRGDVAVAGKLLHLMDRAYYALPRQRPGLGIWSDDECDRLRSRLET